MNKKFLAVFLFLVFSFSLVSSVDISVKKNVKLGENFVIKVSGSFYLQPTTSDIKFYREGIKTSFGVIKLEKIEGEYYFFLEIPLEKTPGNYSVVFEDVKYNSGREVITGDISANFIVLDKIVPFSISPPLLITSKDYEVEVQNLMDSKINIDIKKSSKSVSKSGETVNSESFLDAFFNIFKSPVNDSNKESENQDDITKEKPSSGSVITLMSGEKKTLHEPAPEKKGFQILELYYDNEAYGVMIYSEEGTPSSKTKEEENKDNTEKKETEEKKEVSKLNKTEINISSNKSDSDKKTNESLNLGWKTCAEQNGTDCGDGKKCEGKIVDAIASNCCVGTCKVIQKSSTGKVIGWFIIATIAIFLTWFFKKKYKRSGPGKINILKESKPKELQI